jgi:site-specific DNA-methyltransferase (adenine-specific)
MSRPTVTLHLGDCLEVLKTLEDGSVDAVVTDPPYGIQFVKGNTGRVVAGRKSLRRNGDPIVGDERPFDPSPWLRWPCVMFGADHFRLRLPEGGSFHAWDKKAHSTLNDSFSDVEFIWSSKRGKSRIVSHLWKGVQQATEKGRPKYHVSQKPIAVMAQLIEWFTEPGDTVLDPYMGSGSTGVACVRTGRNFIGVEIDPTCHAIAERRIAAELDRTALLEPA